MTIDEIAKEFNRAMQDIRCGYWNFEGTESHRKILAEGIMRMEDLMDPLWEILKEHR